MASQTEENYLKALLHLVNEQGEISVTELSKRLKISSPTANSMIKKLAVKGWVNYKKYKPFDRIMIQFIMWITKGSTDKNTKIEYTNWEKVKAFAIRLTTF